MTKTIYHNLSQQEIELLKDKEDVLALVAERMKIPMNQLAPKISPELQTLREVEQKIEFWLKSK
jgi:hypothetical protein